MQFAQSFDQCFNGAGRSAVNTATHTFAVCCDSSTGKPRWQASRSATALCIKVPERQHAYGAV
jgi:hypothetical protein